MLLGEADSLKIHHIGYAVKDIAKAYEKFKELGYLKESDIIKDDSRKVYIQFLIKDDYRIEIISPSEKGAPIEKILKRGNTPYHICYEVFNLEEEIEKLQNSGYTLTQKPEKAPAIGNRKVAFMFSMDMGLIELVENGLSH